MGKLNRQNKVYGHWLYITATCPSDGKEPPHIHSNRDSKLKRATAGKIWVKQDGSSQIQNRGEATDSELRGIQEWIADNIAVIEAEWEKLGGVWIWLKK